GTCRTPGALGAIGDGPLPRAGLVWPGVGCALGSLLAWPPLRGTCPLLCPHAAVLARGTGGSGFRYSALQPRCCRTRLYGDGATDAAAFEHRRGGLAGGGEGVSVVEGGRWQGRVGGTRRLGTGPLFRLRGWLATPKSSRERWTNAFPFPGGWMQRK